MSTPTAARADTAAPVDIALLGVAVFAISTSAPLIRYAAAPALSLIHI